MGTVVRRGPARVLPLLALAAGLGAAGCGGSAATVTGTVTYKGANLKGGTVLFTRADGTGTPALAVITEAGTYTAENVPAGETKVTVKTSNMRPEGGGRGGPPPGASHEPPPGAPSAGAGYKGHGGGGDRYVPIPEKYEDPRTTPLNVTVKGGSMTYDIPLTD